jgi:hypothetical protein
MTVQYFKATRDTHRFRANQKVWIRMAYANSLEVWFKWRGSGRYVSGTADRFAKAIGEIKEIEVSDAFGERVCGRFIEYQKAYRAK